jgi:hypothetical protein
MEKVSTYQQRVTCIGDVTNACKVLVRKHERKRPSEGRGYKWEDNIKVYVQEGGCECVCGLNSSGSGQGLVRWRRGYMKFNGL